jgi:beta-galactosidase
MGTSRRLLVAASGVSCFAAVAGIASGRDAPLPAGVKVVWDLAKAYRETTATRERISINGLWRWQPADEAGRTVPSDHWGYYKVPAPWPANCQTLYPHPTWQGNNPTATHVAWYQREIAIPDAWQGRRVAVYAEHLNSYAGVYLDGNKVGDIYFPSGEVDITAACRPGRRQVLSLCVKAAPLSAVMQAFTDTGTPRTVKGTVERRGPCGDVFLVSTPEGARVDGVTVRTSVRRWTITFGVALHGLEPGRSYRLRAQVNDNARKVKEFTSDPFRAGELKDGRFAFAGAWKPDKLWDTHTPQNMYHVEVSLVGPNGLVLDAFRPVRFGFREFWIKGRDFYLNGTRFHSFVIPFDNAQMGAAWATYDAARETLLRGRSFGVNTVYTHNYGCAPGSHLSFSEFLRAADDVGMLVALSQPHCRHYQWDKPDAEKANGYARHAAFYVRMAGNHPSVVMYSMNHNALSYHGDCDPELTDGRHNAEAKIGPRTDRGALQGLKAQSIVERLDPTRVVYHHSSGTLGKMHTLNLYLDFVPIQERSDWFERWATEGAKPLMFCEYGVPWGINWTLYRGWYKGVRSWGSARLPWEFCEGEWNSQFLGDRAFQLSDRDKTNLRWEARRWRAGGEWNKWHYPYNPSSYYSWGHKHKDEVWAMYIADNWRAFRTWGISARNAWGYSTYWELRDGVRPQRRDLKVDWGNLQRPGLSPDFVPTTNPTVDTALERSDWIPTKAAQALVRNNMPLLAYIAGKPAHFTTKEHNYLPGQTVRKQVILINDSRRTVECHSSWSLALPEPVLGSKDLTIRAGQQERVLLSLPLPRNLKPGPYELKLTARFSTGETQRDAFAIHLLPPAESPRLTGKTALFDPKGETGRLLRQMGLRYETVAAHADLAGYDVFIVGKGALTVEGPAPDISKVRDGLRVILFEQTADVLERRLGFRVQEYGLRRVFPRVPDHPLLSGLGTENLRDWSGQATILPSRLTGYTMRPRLGPTIKWCGIELPRAYRAGNWGNVASVLIEKPACGNFLPIVDGGFSLQFGPLMEYREGKGVVLLCQMDVTGRTEADPAAARLVANVLNYVSTYSPPAVRKVSYVGQHAGRKHLEQMGLAVAAYQGGTPGAEQVLVVGPGGGRALAPNADAVRKWIKAGGPVLAIGLGQEEANSFLPFSIETQQREYICSAFDPLGRASLLAGVGPADVMSRDPGETALVSGGARVVGDGALAVASDANVVFCQLAPWEFEYRKHFNQKRTFRRVTCLVTRVLGNMGVDEPAPLLRRFSSPVKRAAEENRWLVGFYLDKPEEFDDPYRYFQW